MSVVQNASTTVGPDGVVVEQWPGYDKAMLKELDERIANLANCPPVVLDSAMAPDKMSSGCYFDMN